MRPRLWRSTHPPRHLNAEPPRISLLALILTFSSGEKEQPLRAYGFANERPAASIARPFKATVDISPSLEERAGVRTSVSTNFSFPELVKQYMQ